MPRPGFLHSERMGETVHKTLTIDGGQIEYTLERKRVKNINLRVRSDASVYVSAPQLVPMAAIETMLRKNAAYIMQHRAAAEARLERVRDFTEGRAVRILGRSYAVIYRAGAKNGAELYDGAVYVTLRNPDDADAGARALEKWLRALCAQEIERICERVYPAFEAMGAAYPEIKLRRMTSRWGSCRPKAGALTFNTGLIHTDEACIEYVVTHEFCHFIHPDHSPAFHALMTRLMPDWRERKKRLNETPFPGV